MYMKFSGWGQSTERYKVPRNTVAACNNCVRSRPLEIEERGKEKISSSQ